MIVTRSQLVGMVATLRGVLYEAKTELPPDLQLVADITEVLNATTGWDYAPGDLLEEETTEPVSVGCRVRIRPECVDSTGKTLRVHPSFAGRCGKVREIGILHNDREWNSVVLDGVGDDHATLFHADFCVVLREGGFDTSWVDRADKVSTLSAEQVREIFDKAMGARGSSEDDEDEPLATNPEVERSKKAEAEEAKQ
jgi:hypothetical protein